MKAEELTFQQKLWKGAETILWGVKPAALYLFFPPLLACAGMILFGGRSAGKVLEDSGNFYYTLGMVLTVILLHRRSTKSGTSLRMEAGMELKELAWKKLLALGVIGLGFALFFSAILTVIPFPPGLMESYHSSQEGFKNGTDQILAIAATILLAPAVEEIVFRGYMLGRFLSWFKEKEAIVLSAVIFAICHVSPLWMIYACFMGILLGWVSVREDNTAYSVALHVGFNFSVILTEGINSNEALKRLLLGSPLGITCFGGIWLAAALVLFDRYRREKIV